MSTPTPVPGRRTRRLVARAVIVSLVGGVAAASCAATGGSGNAASAGAKPLVTGAPGVGNGCPGTDRVRAVVAENVWGSIAAQLGGPYVDVTTIINSPDADPHDYESTADDARTIASAHYVVANGAGYDPWVRKLVDASPNAQRVTLDIAEMLGLREGDNPHRWYFPDDVDMVIDRITADYKKLDPADAACFDQLHADYKDNALQRSRGLLAQIKRTYDGTPVGASESIVEGLAAATGLRVLTPPSYMDAISEGNDPSAQDRATVERQINDRQVEVFVFNSQNATPDVRSLVDQANAANIPVAAVTETLAPADETFQDWQAGQLQQLLDALGRARGE